MPLALASASYPLLDIFWTILEIVIWVIWVWVLIWVFIGIFRSHDLSGTAKALWFLFVLLIPLVGVLAYLIVRRGSMHERALERARQQEDAFRQYIRREAPEPQPSTADQLEKLADLRDRGVITSDEFQRQKDKVLAA
jgi:type VI protein secretion system component VasK